MSLMLTCSQPSNISNVGVLFSIKMNSGKPEREWYMHGTFDPSMESLQTHLKPLCLSWFLYSSFDFMSWLPTSFQHAGFAGQSYIPSQFWYWPYSLLTTSNQITSSHISQWHHAYYHGNRPPWIPYPFRVQSLHCSHNHFHDNFNERPSYQLPDG